MKVYLVVKDLIPLPLVNPYPDELYKHLVREVCTIRLVDVYDYD